MSGGGKKKKKDEEEAVEQTAYGNAPVSRTFQPSLPGGLDMLASQLQQGFGSGGGDMSGFLSDLYQPMDILQFQEPISTTKEQFDKKTNLPIDTGNPYLDELLMGGGDDDKKKKKSTYRFFPG